MGIDELKDVVRLGASLGNAVGKSLEDGKVGVGDIGHFFDPLTKIGPALSGIELVPAEIADLDPTEVDELVVMVVEEFDIPQNDAEEFIEDSIKQVASLYSYVDKYFLN
jgi:hypothetical protein